MTQTQLAEWGKQTFNLESLKQNTVSNILAANAQVQTGRLTQTQRNLILEHNRSHPTMTQKDLAAWAQSEFNLKNLPAQSSISDILNKKLRSMNQAAVSSDSNRKRVRTVKCPELDDALVLWVLQCEHKSIPINMPLIQAQAKRFAKLLEIPEEKQLSYSLGWCQKFMSFYNLRCVRMTGESASADEEAIKARLPDIIAEIAKYRRCDVFNMDETGLAYRMAPDRTISTRQVSGSKKEKSRITIAFTANSDGSEKLPPLFIGHSRQPHAFKKKSADHFGLLYRFNKKAWMTAILFQEWILNFEKTMSQQGRKVLLLLDNAPTHIVTNLTLNHVVVMFLPPNTTSRIQPMDAGIIAAVKKRYRSFQLERALDLEQYGPKKMFHVDVLQAMKWATAAWDLVTIQTIQNCWRHTGVLGDSSVSLQDGVSDIESSSADKELCEKIGRLGLKEPMSVEELIRTDHCEDVHQIFEGDDIVEHVKLARSGSGVELQDLSEDEVDVEEIVPLSERIHCLRTTIAVLDEDPVLYGSTLKELRKILSAMLSEDREIRQSKLVQPEITSFFTKS